MEPAGGGIERLICATSPGTKCKRPTGPARPTSVACAQCPLEWPAPRRLARQPSQLSGPPPPLGGKTIAEIWSQPAITPERRYRTRISTPEIGTDSVANVQQCERLSGIKTLPILWQATGIRICKACRKAQLRLCFGFHHGRACRVLWKGRS